jgi:hypothetical protein
MDKGREEFQFVGWVWRKGVSEERERAEQEIKGNSLWTSDFVLLLNIYMSVGRS